MENINKKPDFENGLTKWYIDKGLTDFAKEKQNDNAPSLETVMCFAVIGKGISNYVLVDNKQNILLTSHYGLVHSLETMQTKITALKVSSNFDKQRRKNKGYEKL